jgi:3-dehydroquinate synthase
LNFGHTIGHALESYSLTTPNPLLHGEAIAAGMIMETEIAQSLKRISVKEQKEITDYIRSIYKNIKITKDTESQLLQYILHDKKNEGDDLCFALPKGVGAYELYCGVKLYLIKKAISNY